VEEETRLISSFLGNIATSRSPQFVHAREEKLLRRGAK